jgi:prephenate dehydrogenase
VKAALIGVGLIGGSLLAAWRRAGIVTTACGYDPDPQAIAIARERGLIDAGADSVGAAVAGAQLVIVATPVGAMAQVFEALAAELAADALITDVGSTKATIIDAARARLGPAFPRIVPAHPIAGSEMPGVAFASAEIFHGKRVVVTPVAQTDPEALRRVEQMFAAAGARVERMSAEQHDRVFAAVSHLPHLAAFALIAALAQGEGGTPRLTFGGAGLRDATRIAASSPVMWRDICLANRVALGEELRTYRRQLDELQRALDAADSAALEHVFERASQVRRALVAQFNEAGF